MLIEFSAANYRCFRDRVTLSMEAEPRISERDKTVDTRNIAETPEGRLLRVVGVYGANASGKSNLLGAVRTLRTIVLDSARQGQAGDPLPVDPFRLEPDTRRAPSELEIVFSHDGVQFRYGLAATRARVEREWLLTWTADGEDEHLCFERNGDAYRVGPGWQRDPSIEHKTRAEALHLSVAAAFNHPQAIEVLRWFRRLRLINSATDTPDRGSRTADLVGDERYEDSIRELIRRLDFGIDDFRVIQPDPAFIRSMVQRMYPRGDMTSAVTEKFLESADRRFVALRDGVEFDLHQDESAGTIKAFDLAGPLVLALAHGDMVMIDEFDARLHTLLAKQLVELFQDPRTNPHNAQLVFTSHDTNLLTRTLLRRDQLWFVEKSRKNHASELYSLAELRLEDGKGVRNDARYEQDYLQGKYGAIPFFGALGTALAEISERVD
ncbi:MAG: ATP-binding protein [Myxococcota bacterium]